jgi:hypothetical protein
MPDFRIGAALICDDIRKEVTNKDILIGVYGGAIILSEVPAAVLMCVWLEVLPLRTGAMTVHLRLAPPGDAVPGFQMRVVLDIQDMNSPVTISTPQLTVPLSGPGLIDISIRESEDDEWRSVKTKAVTVGLYTPASPPNIQYGNRDNAPTNSSSPTASPPPPEQSPSDAPATKPRVSRLHASTRRSVRTPAPE